MGRLPDTTGGTATAFKNATDHPFIDERVTI